MKKIFKLSLLAFFVAFASCEDATDIVQDSELNDENAFRTLNDLESGLNGVYNAYTPDGGGDAIFFNDVFTDNIKRGLNNNGTGFSVFAFNIQPGTASAQAIYASRYQTINFANRILRAWDRIAPGLSEADMPRANKLRGELLALRALAHFDVLQYYVEDYSDVNSPGIQLMNFVPELNQTVQRSTVGESFEFIRADLAAADDLLESFTLDPDDPRTDKFFINNDIVKAIRARVALFEGEYDDAEAFANELLNGTNGTTVDYSVVDGEQYILVWEDDNLQDNPEVIFALSRRADDNPIAGNWYTNSVDRNGQVLLEMSRQLYDQYGEWDIRGRGWQDGEGVFVDEDSDPDSNIILIGKYPGGGGRGELINDVKIFRATEMQLIKAEAEARRGAIADARASIQLIWNQRTRENFAAPTIPASIDTEEELLTLILEERRREFAFEAHRYLDLKRLGRELGIGITRLASDCTSFTGNNQCALGSTDFRWTLPIPSIEINANPTIQQNTGY